MRESGGEVIDGEAHRIAGAWKLAGRVRRKAGAGAAAQRAGEMERVLTLEQLEALDAELADHARSAGRLRFEIVEHGGAPREGGNAGR